MSNTVATIEAEAAPSPRRHAFAKAKHWSGILAKFVSVQIIVQAVGLVSGLLLIRTLSQREYAYFTLANTMLATLLLLADVGVSSALSATGGKVWYDKRRFSELIVTGLHVRKSLAWIGGGLALPVLCWMLIRNGTGVVYAVILTIAVLLGASYRLTNDVLTMVPRLHGRIDQLQKLDLISSLVRLALIGAACLTFINAAMGVFIGSLAFGIQYVLLKRWTRKAIDLRAATNAEDKQTIFQVIKQQAPNTIYFCVQGQLMVFLISIFGNTRMIAEIGALSRLAMLFTVISSVMSSIVLPKFARCQDNRRLKTMWWQIMGGYTALSAALLALVTFLPGPFLWLLGRQYTHLSKELVYVIFCTVLFTVTGMTHTLSQIRAWLKGTWLSIPLSIATQAILIPFLDLNSIKGVALLACLPTIPGALPFLYSTYTAMKREALNN